MEDVRSALTAYVTEGEPPLGLSGEAVLSAARLSRRRHLLTGAAALVVVVLALGLAVVVLPHRDQVAGPPCPTAVNTRSALVDRLSCVVGKAVRSLLPSDVRITRLTIPGETPPSDPFRLIADPMGGAPREALFHLGVRVTDASGSGSVYVLMYPAPNSAVPRCGRPEVVEISCGVEQLPAGGLMLTTDRTSGALSYRAALSAPWGYVVFWSNNSGVLEQKDVRLPEQRPEPVLTEAQVRELALTPGLAF
ncbi:hypothetical protein [Amycolatopsis sp. MEPSY49]|uniref:hypothetical protein n=1 Tax=Amycolatopsis sp. MEPSY49 TaxID=3151600 RepID=UPI003EF1DEB5